MLWGENVEQGKEDQVRRGRENAVLNRVSPE